MMPRQGNGGRDELRHGSASTTEPTQATLGEVTPTPSRVAVPATPNSRPPRPRAGAARQAPGWASRRPRSSRPLRTDLRPPQSPIPARLARQPLTWRWGGSAHGGGGRAPTRRVLRRGPGDAGGGGDGRGGHSASSLRGHHLGGAARAAVRGRRPRPSRCGRTADGGGGRRPLSATRRGGSVQLRGRVRPPAQERCPVRPPRPSGPVGVSSTHASLCSPGRDGFAPCPPHTHLSPVPTTARDPHGVGSALSPLDLLGLGCRRLLPATRSRPVLPHLLGRSPDPSHRAC